MLRYPDGIVEKIVDLAPVSESAWVYAPLRGDDVLFASMRVNEDGNALEFGDGRKISAAQIERLPNRLCSLSAGERRGMAAFPCALRNLSG